MKVNRNLTVEQARDAGFVFKGDHYELYKDGYNNMGLINIRFILWFPDEEDSNYYLQWEIVDQNNEPYASYYNTPEGQNNDVITQVDCNLFKWMKFLENKGVLYEL